MTKNGAKAIKHRARDLAVKASRGERAARITGGALKASEVSCQNRLRSVRMTDITGGTSNTL